MNCNTAVFYDVENLISLFHNKGHKTLQLDEIHKRILGLDVVQGISIQRAYADWALQINRNLRSYVLQIGIEPVQIFNTNHNDKVKNAADVSLIIDAVECLSRHPNVENYVIASGDGIFAFLAKKLHEYGKRVIGCGFDRNTNIMFKNACDIFIALEKNDHSLNATVKNLNKGTIVIHAEEEEQRERPVLSPPPPPPKPISPPPAIPTTLPKIKYSEVLVQGNVPILKKAGDIPSELHLIKRMLNLIFDESVPSTNLEISLFRTYVDHFLPSFRLIRYKCKKFVDFMKIVVTNSPYCLVVADGTVVRIALRGTVDEKSTLVEDIPALLFTLQDGTTVNSLFDIEDGVPFTFNLVRPRLVSKPLEKESAEMAELVEITDSTETEEVIPIQDDEFELLDEPESIDEEHQDDVEDATNNENDENNENNRVEAIAETVTPPYDVDKVSKIGKVDKIDKLSKYDKFNKLNKTDSVDENNDNPPEKNSVRKWIKDSFTQLSQDDRLSVAELKRLLTSDYAQEMFALRTPVLKLLRANDNIEEQRLVDGKIRYWKEEFVFRGKTYLVFKEWVERQHRAKFEAWLEKFM